MGLLAQLSQPVSRTGLKIFPGVRVLRRLQKTQKSSGSGAFKPGFQNNRPLFLNENCRRPKCKTDPRGLSLCAGTGPAWPPFTHLRGPARHSCNYGVCRTAPSHTRRARSPPGAHGRTRQESHCAFSALGAQVGPHASPWGQKMARPAPGRSTWAHPQPPRNCNVRSAATG